MILIASASYINPELQAEFGKLPPSFLPLGGKRLYEYQIKLLQNSGKTIYLSLPKSFEILKYDLEKLDNLGVNILFVPDNFSLGKSLSYVLNLLLPIDEGLNILHGDTLFTELQVDKKINNIEISKVYSNYDWTYISNNNDLIFNIDSNDKTNDLDEYIISGYFTLKNSYEFIRALTISEYSFINALKIYSQRYPFTLTKNKTWLDFGLATTYFHSRKSFTTERTFNSLIIEDGYVIKSSEKKNKLMSEINWFENFPKELDLYIPRFAYIDESSYKTEYLYLSALNELYVFGKLPSYMWKQIFESIKNFLIKIHNIKSDKTLNFDYKQKTLERLQQFSLIENISLNKKWIINGVKIPSLNDIINDLEKFIIKGDNHSFIHGDICFSNIMYDFRSNMIKVFDPRGIDFDNKITVYGKSEYDYAKLMHSCVGLYDFIISGYYKLELVDSYQMNFKLEISEEIIKIQKTFNEVFEMNETLYAIMIHLFLSMLPLHNDDRNRQYALLANAFRLYNELQRGLK